MYQAASNWAAAEATRRGLDVTPQLCREILGKSVTETRKRRKFIKLNIQIIYSPLSRDQQVTDKTTLNIYIKFTNISP